MNRKDNIIHLNTRIEKAKKDSNEFTNQFHSELERKYFELTIKTLLNALHCKDDYTWGHSLRVAFYCVSVGKEMGLNESELYELEVSALFHDIGKIGVPDAVLLKPSRLTEEEFQEMKLHPTKSAQILEDLPLFHTIAKNAKHHHERFDGRGYPEGLKGEDIPLFSRIILIADTFDAMTSTRPYRKGLPYDVAFQELTEFSGSQFDPELVKHFISALKKEQNKSEHTFRLKIIDGEFKKDAA